VVSRLIIWVVETKSKILQVFFKITRKNKTRSHFKNCTSQSIIFIRKLLTFVFLYIHMIHKLKSILVSWGSYRSSELTCLIACRQWCSQKNILGEFKFSLQKNKYTYVLKWLYVLQKKKETFQGVVMAKSLPATF